MKRHNYIVQSDERLDVSISEQSGLSRSFVKRLIEEGAVTLNGSVAQKAGAVAKSGDVVDFIEPDVRKLDLSAQDIPIEIIYEDEYMAVVNKPQGMVVHPAPGAEDCTLVNALLFRLDSLSGINGVSRPGIVHRLDKDTSGLLVIAKNDAAHVSLQKQIAEKSAKRFYLALLDGVIKDDNGTIDTFIGRSQKDRKLMAVTRDGRRAVTMYKVVQRYREYTLAEFELKTGRTHQIRVHAKYLHHAVVGDKTYGGSDKFSLNGQLLHACRLELTHPVSGERMIFTAPLPDYFQKVLNKISSTALL